MPDYRCPTCGYLAVGDTLGGRAIGQHYDAEHNPTTQRTPDGWETAAEQLIREAAATGRPFTVAEVLAPIGEHPDPARRSSFNGQLTRRLSKAGVVVKVGATESVKPSTASSLVHQCRGNPNIRSAAA